MKLSYRGLNSMIRINMRYLNNFSNLIHVLRRRAHANCGRSVPVLIIVIAAHLYDIISSFITPLNVAHLNFLRRRVIRLEFRSLQPSPETGLTDVSVSFYDDLHWNHKTEFPLEPYILGNRKPEKIIGFRRRIRMIPRFD